MIFKDSRLDIPKVSKNFNLVLEKADLLREMEQRVLLTLRTTPFELHHKLNGIPMTMAQILNQALNQAKEYAAIIQAEKPLHKIWIHAALSVGTSRIIHRTIQFP